MAGGPGTPALVAAVCEAGALGFLGAGYLPPDAIRLAIREVRARTRRPFGVNLFVPESGSRPPTDGELSAASVPLEEMRRELGVAPPGPLPPPPDFAAQLAAVKEERVAIFSFAFGALPAAEVADLHGRGSVVLGTATTPGEARALEAAGVDAVVAQGAEAGGHRSTFAGPFESSLIGTLALVPQVVDAVRLPVVAAGGIMDGRGIVAALALGAVAVQMGTAFLACTESGTHPLHLEALFARRELDTTRLTRSFSGRPARGFANRFMVEVEKAGTILPYPYQNALTADLRRAAAREGRSDLMAMWAGQGAPMAVPRSARQLVADLVAEAERVAARLR